MNRRLCQVLLQSLQRGTRGLNTSTAHAKKGAGDAQAAAARRQAAEAQKRHLAEQMAMNYGPGVYIPTAEEAAAIERRNWLTLGTLLAAVGGAYYTFWQRNKTQVKPPLEREQLVNWSGTHSVTVRQLYQPESERELEALVAQAHVEGQKLRCVGSGLSPNGLAFCEDGMVSLALLDRIVSLDSDKQQVTVARILRNQGLSLQNYASIKEQTIGGFTQAGAHGTGPGIPPVDEQVVSLRLVTPAEGVLELSKDKEPELFQLAKVGLGCLGVVSEVTLQCVPAERLVEHTFPSTLSQVKKNHTRWLKEHKHLRYMWIPHTDTVIVVTCNPLAEGAEAPPSTNTLTEAERVKPLHDLLASSSGSGGSSLAAAEVAELSATQSRDALLALDPLNKDWVSRVNQAEAEYWRRSEGYRVGWSDELLGFDCGGQQWVLECAFPAGSRSAPSGADVAYMEELLRLVKHKGVAAPAPIEQRWTSGSASQMSPAHGPAGSLHSWVGIIMYLPESEEQRNAVTASFCQYGQLAERALFKKYNAVEHWAKIELPSDPEELAELRARLRRRYPLEAFEAARQRLDPKNILGNELLDTLLR